jgi:hypothetical protein
MDYLDVEEADLVRALIKWGKFQVQKDGNNPTDGQKLRSTIWPALKLVRFTALLQKEFAQLCLEELGEVMHVEERHSVLMAIVTGQWELLPSELAMSEAATPRKRRGFIVCQLGFQAYRNQSASLLGDGIELSFQLNQRADFVGLKVDTSNPVYAAFNFDLYDSACVAIGRGCSSGEKINAEGYEFVKITPTCNLAANTPYTVSLTFDDLCWAKPSTKRAKYPTFALEAEKIKTTLHGLTLTIISSPRYVNVNVEKFLFK